MNKIFKNCLVRLTNKSLARLRDRVPHDLSREEFRYAQISFSQFGEDMAVERWVEQLNPPAKIYVDVGCFHPIHCSNTLLLYKRGWKGVNIDFDGEKIARFEACRPADYNLVAAVSSKESEKRVFRYEVSLTNRLGELEAEGVRSAIGTEPVSSSVVRTRVLDSILAEAPWPIPQIGYLNIDCEGHDLEVLKGLSLDRYKPTIVTIEALTEEDQCQIRQYLLNNGYTHREIIYRTLVFTLS
jgi:FkbM family methyltransferase